MRAHEHMQAKFWLVGAVLSVAASFLVVGALCLQRRAHVKAQGGDTRSNPQTAASELAPNIIWLIGSALLWLALFFAGYARFWAPGITVSTVQTFAPLVNVAFSQSLLLEEYGLKDVGLTCIAIMGALAASAAQTSAYELPGPNDELNLKHSFPMSHNEHFIIYCVVWICVIVIGLMINSIMRCSSASLYSDYDGPTNRWHGLYKKSIQKFTMPLLAGFFFAAWQVFFYICLNMMTNNGHLMVSGAGFLTWGTDTPDWNNLVTVTFTVLVIGLAAVSGAGAFSHFDAGTQIFESRYFVTTSLCICLATMSFADVLFSRRWWYMTHTTIITFCLANVISVLAAFLVSSEDTQTATQTNTGGIEQRSRSSNEGHSLLKDIGETPLLTVSPGPKTSATSDTWWYQVWFAFCRSLPMLVLLQVPLVYAIFIYGRQGHTWACFCLLTGYQVWSTWQFGFHVLVFSIGGQRKIDMANVRSRARSISRDDLPIDDDDGRDISLENGNPGSSYGMRRPDSGDLLCDPHRQCSPFVREDVFHVVVLASYKEHMHIMREAIETVAVSSLAATQICMVLAMEEREVESREKGAELVNEFRSKFKHIFATFHPKDIPGEVASKASNMHWATGKISEYIRSVSDLSDEQVIQTVADADSNFHPAYFDAITEAFLGLGSEPDSKRVIWQPPMMHFKNYAELPSLVRVPLMMAVTHELANLADPITTMTAMPFSTYSIPHKFLVAAGDFDPDWVSEDWHIGCKLRLATLGKCQFRPIFLPVLNYGPEDETWLKTMDQRWQQMKRHALAYTELTYVWASIPLAWASLATHPDRFSKMGTYIWQCVIPLSLKIVAVHAFLGFIPLFLPLNAYMLHHFWSSNAADCVGSWVYVIDLIALSTNVPFVIFSCWSGVFLFEQNRHNTVYAKSDICWLNWKSIHCIRIALEFLVFVFTFFYLFCISEWLAALQGLRTHKFVHDVALKPSQPSNQSLQHLADMVAENNKDDVPGDAGLGGA